MKSFLVPMISVLVASSLFGQSPPLAIRVDEDRVSVSNVTKGGSVVLFSCARTTRDMRPHLQQVATVLHDDNADGAVEYPTKVPLRSVWIAVDQLTGASAVAAHPQFPLRAASFGSDVFRRDLEGNLVALDREIPRLVLLLVRPGKGSWVLRGRDGAAGDDDRTGNGRLSLAFADGRAVAGNDKAPKHLQADDVIAAVDPSHLDVFTARVAK